MPLPVPQTTVSFPQWSGEGGDVFFSVPGPGEYFYEITLSHEYKSGIGFLYFYWTGQFTGAIDYPYIRAIFNNTFENAAGNIYKIRFVVEVFYGYEHYGKWYFYGERV